MNLSCGALQAKDVIERKFGWRVMPDRVASLTVPHRGRPSCHYCDQCQRGCFTASYFNSPSVTLPAAARTGKFTLVSDAIVSDLLIDRSGRARASTTSTGSRVSIARSMPRLSSLPQERWNPPASC
jgi:hypothetical protein